MSTKKKKKQPVPNPNVQWKGKNNWIIQLLYKIIYKTMRGSSFYTRHWGVFVFLSRRKAKSASDRRHNMRPTAWHTGDSMIGPHRGGDGWDGGAAVHQEGLRQGWMWSTASDWAKHRWTDDNFFFFKKGREIKLKKVERQKKKTKNPNTGCPLICYS